MQTYVKYSPPASPLGSPPGSPHPLSQAQRPSSPTSAMRHEARHTATAKRNKYLRRLYKFRQMDFEYAFWQMLYLFISPQKVYRNFHYRKQTKDQWARDDPAFLVLLSICLLVSSIGFSLVLHFGVLHFIKFIIWVIFVDTIGVGLLIASLFWLMTNRYMVKPDQKQNVEKGFVSNRYLLLKPNHGQDVEWGYCFDVHLNAFFPLLMILHFVQLPFLNMINGSRSFLPIMLGNTFWMVAVGYYIYITFLGYSSLPFLRRTQVLLTPLTGLFLLYILSLVFYWNFTEYLCRFYRDRVW